MSRIGRPSSYNQCQLGGRAAGEAPFQVRRYFGSRIAVVPGEVDLAGKPSTIKRIKTGEVLR
jgi:hypothetical protein